MNEKRKNEIKDLSKRVEALEKQAEELSKRKENLENQIKELSKRIENFEKQMREEKEQQIKKLKAELEYAKFRCALPNIMEMMSHN